MKVVGRKMAYPTVSSWKAGLCALLCHTQCSESRGKNMQQQQVVQSSQWPTHLATSHM